MIRKFMRAVAVLVAVNFLPVEGAVPSALWGNHGESWTPESRLPDFSFAGYHCGGKAIPEIPIAGRVTDFGAKGDGVTDDTEAFRKAVSHTKKGTLLIPAGRYVLRDTIRITQGGLVLRGAGIGKTVLVMPQSLSQIKGKSGRYMFGGGFIEVVGGDSGKSLSEVTQEARRGARTLVLRTAKDLKPGDWIRLVMNNSPSLGRHLHAGQADAAKRTLKEMRNLCDRVIQVTSIRGNQITVDRPLRLDVRPEWEPRVWSWKPTVQEVGIESLSFEFAGVPKKPHLQEEGFNAIDYRGAVNSWVRNVEIIDADNGVILGRSRFCTVEGVLVRAAKRKGLTGHHALWAVAMSQDCLFTGFKLETTYEHDLTVEGGANGNVFEKGSGVAINLDHHSNAPYENLFTELEIGAPGRLWNCGGHPERGPHSAARTTLWNLNFKGESAPGVPDWPQINVIGVKGYKPKISETGVWIEPCNGGVSPPNLYRAQNAVRKKTIK